MIDTITDDGQITHLCTGCTQMHTTHISDEEVQFHLTPGAPRWHRTVRLPACACGRITDLKVDFSAQELLAPNMMDADGNALPTHAVALRHMILAAQMEAAGKALEGEDHT